MYFVITLFIICSSRVYVECHQFSTHSGTGSFNHALYTGLLVKHGHFFYYLKSDTGTIDRHLGFPQKTVYAGMPLKIVGFSGIALEKKFRNTGIPFHITMHFILKDGSFTLKSDTGTIRLTVRVSSRVYRSYWYTVKIGLIFWYSTGQKFWNACIPFHIIMHFTQGCTKR